MDDGSDYYRMPRRGRLILCALWCLPWGGVLWKAITTDGFFFGDGQVTRQADPEIYWCVVGLAFFSCIWMIARCAWSFIRKPLADPGRESGS